MNYKRLFRILAISAISVSLLASCKPEEENPGITDPEEQEEPGKEPGKEPEKPVIPELIEKILDLEAAEGSTVSYDVTTDSSWTITPAAQYDWISVDTESFTGDKTVTFTASSTNKTGEVRSAVFTVKAEVYDLYKITVNQATVTLTPLAEGDAAFLKAIVDGQLLLSNKVADGGVNITPAADSYDPEDFNPASFQSEADEAGIVPASITFDVFDGKYYITHIFKELYFVSYPQVMHLDHLISFEQNGGNHSVGLELPQDWVTPALETVELYWAGLAGNLPDGIVKSQSIKRCMMNYNNFTSCSSEVNMPNLQYLQWGSWFKIPEAPKVFNVPNMGCGDNDDASTDGANFGCITFDYCGAYPETFICGARGNLYFSTKTTKLPKVMKLAHANEIAGASRWEGLPLCEGTTLPEVWETPAATLICLQNSGLQGLIPQGIADIPHLHSLYLEGNHLVGAIPHDWASDQLECIKVSAAGDVNGTPYKNDFGYIIPAQFDCLPNNYDVASQTKSNVSGDWCQFKITGHFLGFEKGWGQARYVLYGGGSELDLTTWSDTRLFSTNLREGEKYWVDLPNETDLPRQFVEWSDTDAAAYNAQVWSN